MTITAAQLLASQDALEAAERRASDAWHAINGAKQAVVDAEKAYNLLDWEADIAREEHNELLEQVRREAEKLEY